MKLCTFEHDGALRAGVVLEDAVVDLSVAAPELPRDVAALLAAGPDALARAQSAAAGARERLPLASLRLAAAGPPPAEVPGHRPQLRRPRRRVRSEAARLPDRLQQAVDLRDRPAGSGAHAARLVRARLRGRARLRRRPALPPRAARTRPRGDRGLPGRERRERARLAAPRADHDDGQVLRHARSARALAHHPRRAGRPARPAPAHVGERRAAPGLEHEESDLRLLRPGRAPLDRVHARAGRRRRDRHTGRRRHRDEAAAPARAWATW